VRAGKPSHDCDTCGKSYSSKSSLLDHIGVHSRQSLYDCGKCGKAFFTKKGLSGHSHVHAGEDQRAEDKFFVCKVCGLPFVFEHNLLSHMKDHPSDVVEAKDPNDHVCDKCDNSFKSQEALTKHRQCEHGPYSCDICYKKFSCQYSLVQHKRRCHADLKATELSQDNRTCEICHKKFSCQYSLVQHRRRYHADVQATEFPQGTTSRGFVARRHKGIVEEKPAQKSSLESVDPIGEVEAAADEQRYSCQLCGETFRSKFSIFPEQRLGKSVLVCTKCTWQTLT